MTAVIAAGAGVFGLLVGSFLNVVIYRVPAGKSIVAPPSACPHCGSQVRPFDNIPVLSWLILRGKCRDCSAPIAVRYPLVELGTALFFAAVASMFAVLLTSATTTGRTVAVTLVIIAFLYFAAVSVALALIDIDTYKLPDVIVYPSYVVAAVLLTGASIALGDYSSLIRAGIGMAGLFAAYFLMAFIRAGGMGMGDIKLAGLIGLHLGWMGWGALAVGAFAAFLLAGLYAAALLITRKANRKSGIPFGPWMLLGAWIGIAFGNRMFAAYLDLFGLST